MKIFSYFFVLVASAIILCLQGCDKYHEPDNVVDNSGTGVYNPKNCVAANDAWMIQLYGNDRDVVFDEQGYPISVNGNEVSYPEGQSGSKVRLKWGSEWYEFTIGTNGFAKSAVDNFGVKYKFGYDKDGFLIYCEDDCHDYFIAEYKDGNLYEFENHFNNGGGDRVSWDYTDIPNFGYMPYGFYGGYCQPGSFAFVNVLAPIEEAYLIGLVGNPSANLPYSYTFYYEDGSSLDTYFVNEYRTIEPGPLYLHNFGWDVNAIDPQVEDWRLHPDGI